MMDRLRDLFTPHQRRVIGEEARQLLSNKHFNEAWDALDSYITQNEMSCDPDNTNKAQRLIVTRQLLQGLKREFIRKVEDGEMAKIEMEAIEKARRPKAFVR